MEEGGFFVGFALILFVVGLADDEVAGDVESSSSKFEGCMCIPLFVFFEDVISDAQT